MAIPQRLTRHLNNEEAVRAIALIEDGRSQRYVANLLGVQQSTISRVVQRYRETGQYSRREGQGRRRITTAVDDRFLRLTAMRTRHCTARMLQTELIAARNVHICLQTVRNRLREENIRPGVPARGPRLTREHRVARLQFAREHADWGLEDWSNVMFTDESRFCLYASDRRMPVYRRPGERHCQCNFRQLESFGGGSVMVWGGISFQGRTELVPINEGRMTAHRYITDILEPHVIPYGPFIGDNFLLMHDNARPHVARIVSEYLEEVNVVAMNWPARSPDLNPIEHVWDHLGWAMQHHQAPIRNLNELQNQLGVIWDNMDQEYIHRLFEGLPRRMEAVIRARGGNTRY
jgi:transposase